ncbi:IL23A protein, partial [Buphagus erythrorhynchus]|nr:IL23A protein [Buphagus erythrorhynchus]
MAPLRHLCLCLALLLPPPAAPAPVPLRRPDWAACRVLSRELSRLLATVKEPHSALEGMQLLEEDPQNWPPRIRCSDACDPLTLETNHTVCLEIAEMLRTPGGPGVFRVQGMLRVLKDGHGRPPRHPPVPTEVWAQPFQRHLALKRLRSFTAVMGRVFNHSAR